MIYSIIELLGEINYAANGDYYKDVKVRVRDKFYNIKFICWEDDTLVIEADDEN